MGRSKTKLVLRHFPPTFTSADFDRLLSSLGLLPLVDFAAFYPGKVRTPPDLTRHGTGYLNAARASQLPQLLHLLAAPVPFTDDGESRPFTLQVEYAPYQRIDRRKERRDRVEGSIDQDEDYQRFLAAHTSPAGVDAEESKAEAKSEAKVTGGVTVANTGAVGAATSSAGAGKAVHRTPLVDFLVKELAKEREREPRKERSSRGHGSGDASKVRPGVSYAGAAQSAKEDGGARAVTKADERRVEAEKRRQRKIKERGRPSSSSKPKPNTASSEPSDAAPARGGRSRGRGKGRQPRSDRRGKRGGGEAGGQVVEAPPGPAAIPTPPLGNPVVVARPLTSGPSYASALTGMAPPAVVAQPVVAAVQSSGAQVGGGGRGGESQGAAQGGGRRGGRGGGRKRERGGRGPGAGAEDTGQTNGHHTAGGDDERGDGAREGGKGGRRGRGKRGRGRGGGRGGQEGMGAGAANRGGGDGG